MDKIIVTIFGLLGIAATYWYFLGKKEEAVEAKDSIDIKVEGGYSPSVISIPQGKTTKLNFFRKDPSSCLEEIVLSDFKIKKFLPLNKKTTIEITPRETGTFPFSCGMNMYHGKLIVH
ncbi:hypothetical protein A2963_04410 [Candidatus Roizmanbacteria bacterium RIFCSPLOWO2_01_FULL_40_13]|uniref:EfeO-type cupredoxin-like domain-containing protein n=1 Tax=Candidatus Gottesmanbacteria bacterium RIFCSPHIGHO2_01_FULL_39_10 TaxID=1798375 RepID=A0A1F5ZR00_9BACT|nr:MAG: hypothetical protein A2773_06965 [Candidatus Gottesmanbacteria bacterium RIFCSPHIGHO2_01_FULL_39_10]OGK47629.1 MAG: hypothetical protein A2963_04410 [Candidatus Roizmanbacteria bacterium RIFCSPLOWO2_01_FULL_40_13]